MEIPGAADHRGEVEKTGFLSKLSSRSFPYIPQWRRRYFVLARDRLYYYDKEDSKVGDKTNGVINLHHFDQVLEAGAKESKKATNVFVISSQDRGFFDPGRQLFAADTLSEMNDWIRKLQATLDHIRNNNRPSNSTPHNTKERVSKRRKEEEPNDKENNLNSTRERKKKESHLKTSAVVAGGGEVGGVPRIPTEVSKVQLQQVDAMDVATKGVAPPLESVTKFRVKGPQGRRTPQSRRSVAPLKQRASSLSALEFQDLNDNRETMPWLNRSMDLLEEEGINGSNSQPALAYNYSSDEDDLDKGDQHLESYITSASGMPPPPLPPRSASFGLDLRRSEKSQHALERPAFHSSLGGQPSELRGSKNSLGDRRMYGSVEEWHSSQKDIWQGSQRISWQGSEKGVWKGSNVSFDPEGKPSGTASPVMDDLDNMLMNQSIQQISGAIDTASEAGSDGSTCRQSSQGVRIQPLVESQLRKPQPKAHAGRKSPPDLSQFSTAVHHLQRHVVELDRSVHIVSRDISSAQGNVALLTEAVTLVMGHSEQLKVTLGKLAQEASLFQHRLIQAIQESENLRQTTKRAIAEAEVAKAEQMEAKRDYLLMMDEMRVYLQNLREREERKNFQKEEEKEQEKLLTQQKERRFDQLWNGEAKIDEASDSEYVLSQCERQHEMKNTKKTKDNKDAQLVKEMLHARYRSDRNQEKCAKISSQEKVGKEVKSSTVRANVCQENEIVHSNISFHPRSKTDDIIKDSSSLGQRKSEEDTKNKNKEGTTNHLRVREFREYTKSSSADSYLEKTKVSPVIRIHHDTIIDTDTLTISRDAKRELNENPGVIYKDPSATSEGASTGRQGGYQSLFSRPSSLLMGFTGRNILTKSVSFASHVNSIKNEKDEVKDKIHTKCSHIEKDIIKEGHNDKNYGSSERKKKSSKNHSSIEKKDHYSKDLEKHIKKDIKSHTSSRSILGKIEKSEKIHPKLSEACWPISKLSLEDIPMADDLSDNSLEKSPVTPCNVSNPSPTHLTPHTNSYHIGKSSSTPAVPSNKTGGQPPQIIPLNNSESHDTHLHRSNVSTPESGVHSFPFSSRSSSILPLLGSDSDLVMTESLSMVSLHRPGSTPGPVVRQLSMSTVPEEPLAANEVSTKRNYLVVPSRQGKFAISRQNSSPNIPLNRQTSEEGFPLLRQHSMGVVQEEPRLTRQDSLLSVPGERPIADQTLPLSPSPSMTFFPFTYGNLRPPSAGDVNGPNRTSMELVTGPVLAGSSLQEATLGSFKLPNIQELNDLPSATSSLKKENKNRRDGIVV